MSVTTDAVVIGGGVMGASIIYNLAIRGMDTPVLLERSTLGSGSTGRSSGIIRMHYSTEISTKLAWGSYQIFQNFSDAVGGGDVAFVKTGFLVISPQNEISGLKRNTAIQQSVGVPTSIITLQEARELAPGFVLNEGEAFVWEPESGHADPSGTAMAYANQARELGADIILESPANEVEIDNGKVVAVTTANERYETPVAILATGPWTGRFLDKLGIDLPLEATRHEVFLIRRPVDIIQTHPGGADLANLTYFRPEGSNLTLVGNGNVEHEVNPDTYNTKPTMNYVEDIWTRLAKRIPAMANGEFFTGYAGLYTSTPDMHPIVDKVEGIDGLYICTGFSGHGFKLSPTVGICVSELVIDGAAHTVDIAPLRMSRFDNGDLNPTTYTFRVIA
jgi:glycine/D-amino acid oxidase-like deaminating enzyme